MLGDLIGISLSHLPYDDCDLRRYLEFSLETLQ